MFYSQHILAKKGPLGVIWIAAHLDRKLRKNQIYETSIKESVDSILQPEVPIALRLSGHLLLGVVRIYSRKVNYLFQDCSEALVKLKQVFRPGAVDLPEDAVHAPLALVTNPERYDPDDLTLPALPPQLHRALDAAHAFEPPSFKVLSRDAITLVERPFDVFSSQFGEDEQFGVPGEGGVGLLPMDFEEPEVLRSAPTLPEGGGERLRRTGGASLLADEFAMPHAEDEFGLPMPMDLEGPELPPMDDVPAPARGGGPDELHLPDLTPMGAGKEGEMFGAASTWQPDSDRHGDGAGGMTGLDLTGSLDLTLPTPGTGAGGLPTPGTAAGRTPNLQAKQGAAATKRRRVLMDTAIEIPFDDLRSFFDDTRDIVRPKRDRAARAMAAAADNGLGTQGLSQARRGELAGGHGLSAGAELVSSLDATLMLPSTEGLCPTLQRVYKRHLATGMALASKWGTAAKAGGVGAEAQAEDVAREGGVEAPSGPGEEPANMPTGDGAVHALGGEDMLPPMEDDGWAMPPMEEHAGERREEDGRGRGASRDEGPHTEGDTLPSLAEGDTRASDYPLAVPDGDVSAEELVELEAGEPSAAPDHGPGGWSARTRNVAAYLKKAFEDKQRPRGGEDASTHEAPRLSVQSMLKGRSRREASQMFFEVLVLKTKDYIHVEQAEPFGDIRVSPAPKLMATSS
eukprot:jgi/Mesvir1/1739/Mv21191-RA.1